MPDVTARNEIPIIEAATYFSQKPSHYKDFCHLDAEGHRWIAEALFRKIVEKGLLG